MVDLAVPLVPVARPTINRHLVRAHAAAWIGTPRHPAAAIRGVGCDCVGLLRGLYRELCGAEVSAPPHRADWRTVRPSPLTAAVRHHLVPRDPGTAQPGHVTIYRLGATRAAHAAILDRDGEVIHMADYAAEVRRDGWARHRTPSLAAALPAPEGCDPGPPVLDLDECVAVVMPAYPAPAARVVVQAADGTRLAVSAPYSSAPAALAMAAAIYPHVERMD